MSNEIDDLRNQITQATRQLKSFESILAKNTKSENIRDSSILESAEITKKLAESEQELNKAISGTMSSITGFSKSLANGQGSFAPLTAAMSLTLKLVGKVVGLLPGVGKALEAVVTGASEVANHMIESFDKAYSTFEKISDSGVVTSFTDMKQTARGLNLNYAQTETLLTKHSKNLALFAGSAIKGRQEFEKIAFDSADTRRKFQKLGISSEEFSEMQASYLNQQMRSGKGQQKTTEEMTAGSIQYIKELDTLSKLTGASKKDLQSMREARMNDTKFRAGTVDMPEKIVNSIHGFLDTMTVKSSKELAKGMQDYLSSGTAGGIGEAADIINAFGNEASSVMKVLDQVRSGEIQHGEATDRMVIISKRAEIANRQEAKIYAEQSIRGKNYVGIATLAMSVGKDTQKLIDEENARKQKQIDDEKSENAKLAETKQALQQAGRDLEQMSTSSKLVTFLMNSFATGLELITEKLYEMSGEDLPAHLQAKKEERKALEEEKKARDEVIAAEKRVANNKSILSEEEKGFAGDPVHEANLRLQEKIKERKIITERRIAAEKSAGIVGPSSVSSGEGTAKLPGDGEEPKPAGESGGVKLSTIRSKSGASTSVASDFAKNFQGLINWFDDQGYNIKSLGGYANRNIAGTNTPSQHSKGAAIDINPAENPMGSQRITDMPQGTAQAAKSMGLGWGYNWPNKSDAMHFSASKYELGTLTAETGGITSSGNGENISKRALGSGSMMTNSYNKINEIFNDLSEKMDTLIDLMDTSMNNQQRILER